VARNIKSVVENNMELKILGKIPLENLERKERKKRPEFFAEEINLKMKEVVKGVNEKYGEIVDLDGRIKVDNSDDLRYIEIKESAWAQEKDQSLKEYREKQENSDSSLAEKAITLSLAKVLGSRFISLRSSSYDDYENGIDNVLLDTETGSLVCGFDEVVAGYGQDGSSKKEDKIMKKFAKGGSYAKYGLEINPDTKEVKVTKKKNIPNFYISVAKSELSELLENVSKPDLSEIEKKVLSDVVFSLQYQIEKMKSYQDQVNENLVNNLKKTESFVNLLSEKL